MLGSILAVTLVVTPLRAAEPAPADAAGAAEPAPAPPGQGAPVGRPGHAHMALVADLHSAGRGTEARLLLAAMLGQEGTAEAYAAAVELETVPGERQRIARALAVPGLPGPARASLALRAAALDACASEPATRRAGLRALGRMEPTNASVARALGEAHLCAGDATRALASLAAAKGDTDTRVAERALVAAIAAGDRQASEHWATELDRRGGRMPALLAQAQRTFSTADRATALVDAGLPGLARAVVSTDRHADADARLVAARLLVRDADLAPAARRPELLRAAEAMARKAAESSGSDEARAQAVRLRGRLLARLGQPDAAAALLGTNDPAVTAARARVNVRVNGDAAALEQAWDLWSADPDVAALVGHARAASGRLAEAVEPLAAALEQRPADLPLLRAYVGAARAADAPAGRAAEAREALLRALRDAPDAATFESIAGLLPGVLAGLGALDARLAIALAPDDPDVLRAAGGTLWEAGAEAEAEAAFTRALERAPDDATRVACATLAFWRGARERAEALLAQADPERADVRALRRDMARDARRRRAAEVLRTADRKEGAAPERPDDGAVAPEAALRALVDEDPTDAALLLALAALLRSEGRDDEALEAITAAHGAAPRDAWPSIAEADLLVARGETEEARRILAALGTQLPPDAARERDRAMARALRAAGEAERAAGRLGLAIVRLSASARLDPDPWTRIALAGVYAERAAHDDALALYAALAREADPAVARVARLGQAGALEALGRRQEALAILDALATDEPTEAHVEAREALAMRIAVARADALRRGGDVDGAEQVLASVLRDGDTSPDALAALAAVRLDRGDAAGAVDRALRVLADASTHAWALDVAARAAEACRCARKVLPYVAAAATEGSAEATRWLPVVRSMALVEEARAHVGRHRRDLARAALDEAEARARGNREAQAALARGLWELGWRARARRVSRTLGEAPSPLDPSAATAVPEAAPPPLTPAIPASTPPTWSGSTGIGALTRSGVSGQARVLALYLPVRAEHTDRLGRAWSVEAVPVRVEDGIREDVGISPSIAARTANGGPLGASARVGTSPIGFDAGFYPTWSVQGRWTPWPALSLTAESARVPLVDSLPAWAGSVDAASGVVYGGVSHAYGGLGAAIGTGYGLDAGLLARVGASAGVGMRPNPRRDAVAWVGQRIGSPARGVRVSAEGVYAAHAAQADAFSAGAGAYYSPPLFVAGVGRVEVRWHGTRGRFGVCADWGAGMQHATGTDTPTFASGNAFTHNGRVALVAALGGAWRLEAAGFALFSGPIWHSEAALLQLRRAEGPEAPTAAAPLSTFAGAGQGIVHTGEPC